MTTTQPIFQVQSERHLDISPENHYIARECMIQNITVSDRWVHFKKFTLADYACCLCDCPLLLSISFEKESKVLTSLVVRRNFRLHSYVFFRQGLDVSSVMHRQDRNLGTRMCNAEIYFYNNFNLSLCRDYYDTNYTM